MEDEIITLTAQIVPAHIAANDVSTEQSPAEQIKAEPAVRQTHLVAMMLGLLAAMAPAATRAQSSPEPTIYDQPFETTHGIVKSDLVESGGGLICYRYSPFVVKEIDSGSVSV
jgi:hypothetical protein